MKQHILVAAALGAGLYLAVTLINVGGLFDLTGFALVLLPLAIGFLAAYAGYKNGTTPNRRRAIIESALAAGLAWLVGGGVSLLLSGLSLSFNLLVAYGVFLLVSALLGGIAPFLIAGYNRR